MVGEVQIGGGAPIPVQSMTKVPTTDVKGVLTQIEGARCAGGDIMRISVPDTDSAKALREIVRNSPLPIVADIHFDYKLALKSIEAGAHKIRINPGNIVSSDRLKIVAKAALEFDVPIRIGVNSGSLPKYLHHLPIPDAMVQAAEREIDILTNIGFENIVVSLKSSSLTDTLQANLLVASKFNFPLHLGITESGFGIQGRIASTIGLTQMLNHGIGDTIRVSLSEEPVEEVRIGREILRSMDLRSYGIRFISCPRCARCNIDTLSIAKKVWEKIKHIDKSITVAVMGCVVNGPGEASHADIGVACGINHGLIFAHGEPIRKISEDMIADELISEVMSLL